MVQTKNKQHGFVVFIVGYFWYNDTFSSFRMVISFQLMLI